MTSIRTGYTQPLCIHCESTGKVIHRNEFKLIQEPPKDNYIDPWFKIRHKLFLDGHCIDRNGTMVIPCPELEKYIEGY
jgi:hypothetical protein